MNNQPIGILDSGIGGLSIWREIVRQLPHESTIYVADSTNCPYGERSEQEVYRLTKKIVDFLVQKNVKLIVIACNTATVSALEKLRQDFKNLPIVGTVPVVKTAAENSKTKKIGILSTTITAKSDYQKDLIKNFATDCEVVNIGTDKLVPFIEKGDTNSMELKKTLVDELEVFKKAQIDSLALGCSHYPFLKKEIQSFLGKDVLIFDSGGAVARQVKRVLANNNTLSLQEKPAYRLYTTGDFGSYKKVVKKILGEDLALKIQTINKILI